MTFLMFFFRLLILFCSIFISEGEVSLELNKDMSYGLYNNTFLS